MLRADNSQFREHSAKTHRRFQTTGDDDLSLNFACFNISRTSQNAYSIDQAFYHKKVEELDLSSSFSEFRSMKIHFAWLTNTRPDLQFELEQVTEQRCNNNTSAFLKKLNANIPYANNNVAQIQFPKLDKSSIRIVRYSEAAFTNNFGFTSQLRRIILIVDKAGNAIPSSFKSCKSRRVTRSVLATEVIGYTDLLCNAYALRSQVEQYLRRGVPMHLLTDPKSLFDIISNESRTSEKSIIVGIHATRQAYQQQ